MAATIKMDPDLSRSEADIESYAIVERLADAARAEADAQPSSEDQVRLVKELYEGPKKCRCCINWVDETPAGVEIDGSDSGSSDGSDDEEDETHPLILRRTVMRGEGRTQAYLHSIEIRSRQVRGVLFEVFKGLDGLHPRVKYLTFLAPFHQFFWRWDVFEAAIEKEENPSIRSVLLQLRSIVKRELAEALAVSKELTRNGVIAFKYLWTIFPPGELIYYTDRGGADRFCILQSSSFRNRNGDWASFYALNGYFVDRADGSLFYQDCRLQQPYFHGTREITKLSAYPAKYMTNYDQVRDNCIKRGQKFRDLSGIQYKSYRPRNAAEGRNHNSAIAGALAVDNVEIRIVIDGSSSQGLRNRPFYQIRDLCEPALSTGTITQAPVDATPPGGHRPLAQKSKSWKTRSRTDSASDESDGGYSSYESRRRGDGRPIRNGDIIVPVTQNQDLSRPQERRGLPIQPGPAGSSTSAKRDLNTKELSDLQLQLCNSRISAYSLRDKKWGDCEVDQIEDVEWNPAPFESLVLPDGYKDLILSFVESQLKHGEAFADVINGKGGGLVILLSGDPGVGKTLTAESVAEKIHAPLYKMELAKLIDIEDGHYPPAAAGRNESDITTAFSLAAKWKAVLLIDECDLYLAKRKDDSPTRNRVVARFLQELEYYPSLLFLTTNREKQLDPAIYSRIHLTINYPPLDSASRHAIWQNFLQREEGSTVSTEELDVLAAVDIDGRRIRNVTKTAAIMAKRQGRGISFEDIKQVMRITEGLRV